MLVQQDQVLPSCEYHRALSDPVRDTGFQGYGQELDRRGQNQRSEVNRTSGASWQKQTLQS